MATKHDQQSIQQKLLAAIGQVDRPGTVCRFGDLPMVLPGLDVEGLGEIRLPLGKTQARKLIKCCQQAPYGRGVETVVDTKIRRVWELDPAQFELCNVAWSEFIAIVALGVQRDLGLGDHQLRAELYKLLIYERGSFFLPHRDGEKLDGMVATLVIVLPSAHQGGTLVVSHEGQRHEIDFAGAASGFQLSYAAFYADCEHEVLPLQEGYRLSLVYNLVLAKTKTKTKSKSKGKSRITAPASASVISAVAHTLQEWKTDPSVRKLAIALEHQYTQDGLNINLLKGVDRARADVLFAAAEQAGCVAHLALVTRWEAGSAEPEDDYRYGGGYGGRGRWNHYDDEDNDDDEQAGEDLDGKSRHVMEEVVEEDLSADYWSDREGNPIQLGRINLAEAEIVCEAPFSEWKIAGEDYEGYTGNAGMTLERWYHRAAIVLWPRENHYGVLCQAGTDAAISGLEVMVKGLPLVRKADHTLQLAACRQFAAAIIESWGPRRFYYFDDEPPEQVDRAIFPKLLMELDDPALMNGCISKCMKTDGGVQLGREFLRFAKKHGWQIFEASLLDLVEASSTMTLVRNTKLLRLFDSKQDNDQQRITVCRNMNHCLANSPFLVDKLGISPQGRANVSRRRP